MPLFVTNRMNDAGEDEMRLCLMLLEYLYVYFYHQMNFIISLSFYNMVKTLLQFCRILKDYLGIALYF